MALRMFRYGYHEAIDKPKRSEDGSLTIRFPQARVLYWETTRKTPDTLILHVIFPDGSRHDFQIPAFKVLEHDIAELHKKKLSVLFPFYILKYRKQVSAAKTPEDRSAVVPELAQTLERLTASVDELEKAGLLTEEDKGVILGEMNVLYTDLYRPYKEIGEARVMLTLEERLENPYIRAMYELKAARQEVETAKQEAKTAEQEVKMAKQEVKTAEQEVQVKTAQNLLKAGVAQNTIAQATGLTPAAVRKLAKTLSQNM